MRSCGTMNPRATNAFVPSPTIKTAEFDRKNYTHKSAEEA